MHNLTNYLMILFWFGVLLAIKYLLTKKLSETNSTGNFQKKDSLLTKAENDLYKVLQAAVGDKYQIFPQINLDKFIKPIGNNSFGNFHKINQKSVDFLLCEKKYLQPLLAIELNDSSHTRFNRITRDQLVSEILANANMPILTISWSSTYNPIEIKNLIDSKLTTTL